MDWRDWLARETAVCGGELRACGTRIPVTVILDSLAEGAAKTEILASYPSLKPEHIDAALSYAAELAHEDMTCTARVSMQTRC